MGVRSVRRKVGGVKQQMFTLKLLTETAFKSFEGSCFVVVIVVAVVCFLSFYMLL